MHRFPAVCVLPVLIAGCSPRGPAPPTTAATSAPAAAAAEAFQFRDVTAEAGIESVYQNGREAGHYAILESLGGGVALIDFDLDGNLDLLFPGGGRFESETIIGRSAQLYRNTGALQYRNVTQSARADRADRYTHGCAVGDVDNDGFPDVLVTGYGGLQFLRNLGDGTFVNDEQAAGLVDPLWSSSAAWGDLNGDGALDLYVAHYVDWSFEHNPRCPSPINDRDVCPPRVFDPLPDAVYYSNGDGTFRNASAEAGLRPDGKGLGVLMFDADHDGDLDVYVANDTTENFLYTNDGGGRLTECGLTAGVAYDSEGKPNGSMGLAICDFDANGLPDLWVTNFENENFALYRNEGGDLFVHVSRDTRIAALGSLFVGFGTVSGDFDLDGDEDLAVACGHILYFPTQTTEAQVPLLLEQTAAHQFQKADFSSGSYFAAPHVGRGLAVGDLNSDGRLDLVFVNTAAPAAILINTTGSPGNSVGMRLIGRWSPRDGTGARAELHTTAGDLLRHLPGGGSYLSHNAARLHWGLPPGATAGRATILWPSGFRQTLDDPKTGTPTTIVEPTRNQTRPLGAAG